MTRTSRESSTGPKINLKVNLYTSHRREGAEMADNPLESLVTQTQVQSVEIAPPDSKPPESSSQSEPTELELIAMEMGWNPDKDTVGDQWVDARTYIKRTHDIQKTQARTIKDTSRKLEKVLS